MCKDRTKDNIGIHILSIFYNNKANEMPPEVRQKTSGGTSKLTLQLFGSLTSAGRRMAVNCQPVLLFSASPSQH